MTDISVNVKQNFIRITAIMVVYNKSIGDVISVPIIAKHADLIIVDNSEIEFHNKEACDLLRVDYISMEGNKGLSKAYNTAIERLTDADVIVILDDDTHVTENFFTLLRSELYQNPDIDVFVPIIRGQDGVIYSPNNYKFLKNELLHDPIHEIDQKRFNAISSCMAIRSKVFLNYRYNEKLFVDEVDHCFCREQRNRGCTFKIIDTEIQQNFHQRECVLSPKAGWKRLQLRIYDIYRHARLIKEKRVLLQAFIKSIGLGIQIGFKSRSLVIPIKAIRVSFILLFKEY